MDFENFENIDETNIDIILEEIKDFIQLYLFKGNVSPNTYHITKLFELSANDLNTLKTVHFLLSDEVDNLIKILPEMSKNLAHSTQKETKIMKGHVQGNINWNKTLKERYLQGFNDKSLFVCSNPTKYVDLEQNQLLKFLLNQIKYLKEKYLKFVKVQKLTDIDDNEDWYKNINKKYESVKLTLKKVYFKQISDVEIKTKHVRRCVKSRDVNYQIIAKAYLLYEKLFIKDFKKILLELINKRIIKITNPHKLYELYLFFNLIKALHGSEVSLLFSGNNYSSKKDEITIYYQKTPDPLNKISKYKKIIEKYNIKGKIRSPDIIIEFKKDNKTYYRIVEVKNTSSGDYIRDSIYKVMGYYEDFREIENLKNYSFTEKYPIVLVLWGGISAKKEFSDKIIVLDRTEFIANIDKLIESGDVRN